MKRQQFGELCLTNLLSDRAIVVAGRLFASPVNLRVNRRSFCQIILPICFGAGVKDQQRLLFFIERIDSCDRAEYTMQRIIINGRDRLVLMIIASHTRGSDPHQSVGRNVNPVVDCVCRMPPNMRTGG